ncbi:MAG TPA: hypothetical protein VMI12_14065 [Puia sp.]|nr:hypothetical protein [Puia sp.]
MSLDNIQLPAFVVTDLFKHSIVMPDEVETKEKKISETPDSFNFLGNNQKKIVLIVRSTEAFLLPDQYLLLLTKMLEACKLNLGDVAIINHHTNPVTMTGLNKQLSPSILILFGLETTAIKLPFNIPLFKIQEYNQCRFLYVPAIEELSRDTEEARLLKSKLWICLKGLFEV